MRFAFEHDPVIPPRLVRDVPRVDKVWLERFADLPSPDIADKVGLHYTLDAGIRPLYQPIGRLVGQALTVKSWPGDGLAVHGAAALAREGDVLVVDGRGETSVSRAGFKMLQAPRKHGLRGMIVDGALRDAEDFQQVDFPVFGRARTPHSSTKRRAGEINVPIACGGVIVEAGDLVVADAEGIVVVPRSYIATVWESVSKGGSPVPDEDEIERKGQERWENYERVLTESGGVVKRWREIADVAEERTMEARA